MKRVLFPFKSAFANATDFLALVSAFFFHWYFLIFVFVFDFRFFGTAILYILLELLILNILRSERGGFEPPVAFQLRQFSRLVHSTTLPPLQDLINTNFLLLYNSTKYSKKTTTFSVMSI